MLRELFRLRDELAELRADFHSFAGSLEMARALIERDFYLGVTGMVTFKKADNIREIAAAGAELERQPERRGPHRLLAESVTRLAHGDDGLRVAQKATEVLYGGEVSDLSDAEIRGITSAEVHQLTDIVRQHWGQEGAPRSALVAPTDFSHGMARMYEMLLDLNLGPQIRVFRNVENAREWLAE